MQGRITRLSLNRRTGLGRILSRDTASPEENLSPRQKGNTRGTCGCAVLHVTGRITYTEDHQAELPVNCLPVMDGPVLRITAKQGPGILHES